MARHDSRLLFIENLAGIISRQQPTLRVEQRQFPDPDSEGMNQYSLEITVGDRMVLVDFDPFGVEVYFADDDAANAKSVGFEDPSLDKVLQHHLASFGIYLDLDLVDLYDA